MQIACSHRFRALDVLSSCYFPFVLQSVGRAMPQYKRLQAAKEAGTISPQEAAQLTLFKANLIQRIQMQLLYETGLNDATLLQV